MRVEIEAVKKLAKDLSLPRPQPSAILSGTDAAALFICEVKPNTSSLGNLEERLYSMTVL